jgi:hypothetical protein
MDCNSFFSKVDPVNQITQLIFRRRARSSIGKSVSREGHYSVVGEASIACGVHKLFGITKKVPQATKYDILNLLRR